METINQHSDSQLVTEVGHFSSKVKSKEEGKGICFQTFIEMSCQSTCEATTFSPVLSFLGMRILISIKQAVWMLFITLYFHYSLGLWRELVGEN